MSPRLIVSRPAAGGPALSPASVHPLYLLLDVRLTTKHHWEQSKLKHFKNTLFVFVIFFFFWSVTYSDISLCRGCSLRATKQDNAKVMFFFISLSSNSVWWWQSWTLCNMRPAPSFWAVLTPKHILSTHFMHWMNKESPSNGITVVSTPDRIIEM